MALVRPGGQVDHPGALTDAGGVPYLLLTGPEPDIRWEGFAREVRDVIAAGVLIAVAAFSALFLVKLPDVSRLFLLVLFVSQALQVLLVSLAIAAFFVVFVEQGPLDAAGYARAVAVGENKFDAIERLVARSGGRIALASWTRSGFSSAQCQPASQAMLAGGDP